MKISKMYLMILLLISLNASCTSTKKTNVLYECPRPEPIILQPIPSTVRFDSLEVKRHLLNTINDLMKYKKDLESALECYECQVKSSD